MGNNLGQVQVTIASLFFDDLVDYVLGTSKVNLTLKQHSDVFVFAHHLDEVDVHVFRLFGEFIKAFENFTDVPHVHTTLMEEFFQ